MAEKMRILHVVGGMDIGGIESMLMTLMPYMKARDITFDFAVHGEKIGIYEKQILEMGGDVFHLPKFKGWNIISYVMAWYKLFANHPEITVVQGHMTSTASIYLSIAKYFGKIVIAHSHSTGIRGNKAMYFCKRFLEYPLRYISDYLCACSIGAAEFRFGKDAEKRQNFYLWINAVKPEPYQYSAAIRKKYRQILNIDDSTVLIGHVGRMSQAKNHKFILRIFKEYQEQNVNSKLLLIGDGPLREELELLAKDLKIDEKVIFLGAIGNTSDYLSAMDVFLFPSLFEGLPIALIEAQINNIDCLVSDVVTNEVEISNVIRYVSLKKDAAYWSGKIRKEPRKENDCTKIENNPYDINKVAVDIEKFYGMITSR
ncbi:glycosyltransferase [Selenomonas ruminantium]|uniref:glycosyltransferase n=1 Tax=Selenomonas ruminantium TaxID=971 RepID=UPI0026EE757A|nr:glycosyltransferase [Selenomonas ruminantium]